MIDRNYYEDNPDLRFIIEQWADWQKIVPLRERNYSDFLKSKFSPEECYAIAPSNIEEAIANYKSILTEVGDVAGNVIAPQARQMEGQGLKLEDGKVIFPAAFINLYKICARSGFLSFPIPREYGGLNMPLVCTMAMKEMLTRANNSFQISIAVSFLSEIIYRFGTEEMKKEYIPKMIKGELSAAMALTEPDYGSDLSHIKTRASKNLDGTYLINGTKRFITHGCGVGDVPALIFTLARTSGEDGRGLSLFLVNSTDVKVSRIEDKLGLHCSPTCELVYEDTPAILFGKEGEGLIKHVVSLLNMGRMGVAIESVGLAQAAYEEAKKYASERRQFGVTIDQFPIIKRMLNEMNCLVQANRSIVYKTAELLEIYEMTLEKLKLEGKEEKSIRKDEIISKLDKLCKLYTSVSKMICSEYGNKVVYDAVQIFGGAGFTEEYDIARLYRDARISTIYEGTSQIHIITAISVITDGMKEGGSIYKFLEDEISKIEDSAKRTKLGEYLKEFMIDWNEYKLKDKFVKDSIAKEIVYQFAHLSGCVFLARQCDVARQNMGTEFRTSKESVYQKYIELSSVVFVATKVALGGTYAI